MKRIVLTLTFQQAMDLRQMVLSSDQMNSDNAQDMTSPGWRALAKLEDAIEDAQGSEFVHRFSKRTV